MDRLSLVSGPLPWVLGTAGFVLLALVCTRWPRRIWWTVPITFAAALALLIGISYWWQLPQKLHGTWPRSFFVWSAFPILAIVAGCVAWARGRGYHRVASVLAVVLLTAFAADRVNIYYGALPTVGDALGAPLPGQVAPRVSLRHEAVQRALPATGVVFPLRIMGTVSHFRARSDYVWLPPVWFSHPRPALPALELIGGSPSFSADWLRGGGAIGTLDAYAKTHDGWGPIVVVADQNGSFTGDTECVNGPRGQADTYVSVDVVRSVDRLFHVAPGPRRWAIAGYSAGGTCALTLALKHPTVYGAFADFSGDLRPNAGPYSTTLRELFGGSAALASAYDPASFLEHSRYPGLFAWFETGRQDAPKRVTAARELAGLARRAGAHVVSLSPPGNHSFYFWQACLQAALPSLVAATTNHQGQLA
jgi:Putative esterase